MQASREGNRAVGRIRAIGKEGPHCAVGQIDYPDGGKGVMVYIESSFTGDENDYVTDYKKRYPQFPHETTADQFFSEEQFEVYRALGFHAGYGVFGPRDGFAQLDDKFPDAWTSVYTLAQLFPAMSAR